MVYFPAKETFLIVTAMQVYMRSLYKWYVTINGNSVYLLVVLPVSKY